MQFVRGHNGFSRCSTIKRLTPERNKIVYEIININFCGTTAVHWSRLFNATTYGISKFSAAIESKKTDLVMGAC